MSDKIQIKENKIYRYRDRDIVLVVHGEMRQPFYRSTGRNSGCPGTWFPFSGIGKYWGESTWFIKDDIIFLGEKNRMENPRFGSPEFKEISEGLSSQDIAAGVEGEIIEINSFLEKENVNDNFWRKPFKPDKRSPFSEKEIEFIYEHYPENGAEYCADHLNIDALLIQKKANRLKLKITNKCRREICIKSYYKNHPQLNEGLCDILFSEMKDIWIYFLGYLWADGHLDKSSNRICMNIQRKDGLHLLNLIRSDDQFSFINSRSVSRKKESWQDMVQFRFSDKNIYNKIAEYGYLDKSKCSAKIITAIPESKRYLWMLGYFDGDGSIYSSQKRTMCNFGIAPHRISISGNYAYDWTDVLNELERVGISRPEVSLRISNKGHRSSCIVLEGNEGIKFINYIYQGSGASIGLERKFEKAASSSSTRTVSIVNNHLKISQSELAEIRNLSASRIVNIGGPRRVERPSYETFLREIDEMGFAGMSKKYGIRASSIRKWDKAYKKEFDIKGREG